MAGERPPDRPAGHRFPPLARRGVVAGWRAGQLVTVAAGLVVATVGLRLVPGPAGLVGASVVVAASLAVAWWPVAGVTLDRWLPPAARYAADVVRGTPCRVDGGPGTGHLLDAGGVRGTADPGRTRRPSVFDGLSVVSLDGPGGPVGAVVDRRAATLTAVLVVRGDSFALVGPTDQERRVGAWAAVLAGLAREGSTVHRVQWLESCLPDDGTAVRRHRDAAAVLPAGAPARTSYDALLTEAAPTVRRHAVLVALSVRTGGTARAVRTAGGGEAGRGAVLARETDALHRALLGADLSVEGVLGPAALTRWLADAVDPGPVDDPDRSAGWPWPMAVAPTWRAVRTDATWHATYWVAEWPRTEVAADFLGPLLLVPVRRTLSVVMEPVSPLRAARQVARARTAGLADGELRRRGGFVTTARHAREADGVEAQDRELADGHARYRFSGYVSVTAPDPDVLEEAARVVEQAAGQCRLELRRLYGQQDLALLCTLPLGRGLS
jgi:hypothetical protein